MKQLFNVRSPLWQILSYGLFFGAAILIVQRPEITDPSSLHTNYIVSFVIGVVLLIILGLYMLMYIRHNRMHPKNRIRYFGLLPPEFREEDEGLQSFTAKATRRVYIFHASALPVMGMIYVYLYLYFEVILSPTLVVSGLGVLVLSHFIIYFVSIWPVLRDE